MFHLYHQAWQNIASQQSNKPSRAATACCTASSSKLLKTSQHNGAFFCKNEGSSMFSFSKDNQQRPGDGTISFPARSCFLWKKLWSFICGLSPVIRLRWHQWKVWVLVSIRFHGVYCYVWQYVVWYVLWCSWWCVCTARLCTKTVFPYKRSWSKVWWWGQPAARSVGEVRTDVLQPVLEL